MKTSKIVSTVIIVNEENGAFWAISKTRFIYRWKCRSATIMLHWRKSIMKNFPVLSCFFPYIALDNNKEDTCQTFSVASSDNTPLPVLRNTDFFRACFDFADLQFIIHYHDHISARPIDIATNSENEFLHISSKSAQDFLELRILLDIKEGMTLTQLMSRVDIAL